MLKKNALESRQRDASFASLPPLWASMFKEWAKAALLGERDAWDQLSGAGQSSRDSGWFL
jgi:hypothetical protein